MQKTVRMGKKRKKKKGGREGLLTGEKVRRAEKGSKKEGYKSDSQGRPANLQRPHHTSAHARFRPGDWLLQA